MAHEVEKMMFVGETPWHGLGTKLEAPPPSVADALKVAGLDWTVSLHQLQTPEGRKVPRFATIRSGDAAILGTVGPGYRVVQNATAFSFFDPFIKTGHASIETAGSLRGGARVWMLAKIARPDSVIVPKSDDRVAKYLLLAQGHDGALAIHVGLTPIRVVCQNTLSAAVPAAKGAKGKGADVSAEGMLRIRHVANAEKMIEAVGETIERADRNFEKAAEFFRTLAGKNVRSAAKLRAYVDAVFPVAKKADADDESPKDRVLFSEIEKLFQTGRGNDLPGVKGTAWAAYNAVTEYLTWERGSDTSTRMNNLWLRGSGAPGRAMTAARDVLLAA
jgi:phage/plasmid-like protein (TIGR03299 family)